VQPARPSAVAAPIAFVDPNGPLETCYLDFVHQPIKDTDNVFRAFSRRFRCGPRVRSRTRRCVTRIVARMNSWQCWP
jgi:hypothetical protein